MVELKSKTDKDGENLFCNAKKINNRISLDGTNNKEKTNNMILPTSYWNYDLVKDKKDKTVLNTQDWQALSTLRLITLEKIASTTTKC